jgi:hypothetical protein
MTSTTTMPPPPPPPTPSVDIGQKSIEILNTFAAKHAPIIVLAEPTPRVHPHDSMEAFFKNEKYANRSKTYHCKDNMPHQKNDDFHSKCSSGRSNVCNCCMDRVTVDEEAFWPTDVHQFLNNMNFEVSQKSQFEFDPLPNVRNRPTLKLPVFKLKTPENVMTTLKNKQSYLNGIIPCRHVLEGEAPYVAPIYTMAYPGIFIAESQSFVVDPKGFDESGNFIIFYFAFFGFNRGKEIDILLRTSLGNHVGDWETVAVHFQNFKCKSVTVGAHGMPLTAYAMPDVAALSVPPEAFANNPNASYPNNHSLEVINSSASHFAASNVARNLIHLDGPMLSPIVTAGGDPNQYGGISADGTQMFTASFWSHEPTIVYKTKDALKRGSVETKEMVMRNSHMEFLATVTHTPSNRVYYGSGIPLKLCISSLSVLNNDGKSTTTYPVMATVRVTDIPFVHPIVYCARVSHGMWSNPGFHVYSPSNVLKFIAKNLQDNAQVFVPRLHIPVAFKSNNQLGGTNISVELPMFEEAIDTSRLTSNITTTDLPGPNQDESGESGGWMHNVWSAVKKQFATIGSTSSDIDDDAVESGEKDKDKDEAWSLRDWSCIIKLPAKFGSKIWSHLVKELSVGASNERNVHPSSVIWRTYLDMQSISLGDVHVPSVHAATILNEVLVGPVNVCSVLPTVAQASKKHNLASSSSLIQSKQQHIQCGKPSPSPSSSSSECPEEEEEEHDFEMISTPAPLPPQNTFDNGFPHAIEPLAISSSSRHASVIEKCRQQVDPRSAHLTLKRKLSSQGLQNMSNSATGKRLAAISKTPPLDYSELRTILPTSLYSIHNNDDIKQTSLISWPLQIVQWGNDEATYSLIVRLVRKLNIYTDVNEFEGGPSGLTKRVYVVQMSGGKLENKSVVAQPQSK